MGRCPRPWSNSNREPVVLAMGNKKGGSSWLTAVKRAFRSPSKEDSPKKSARLREDPDADEDKVVPFPHFFPQCISLAVLLGV